MIDLLVLLLIVIMAAWYVGRLALRSLRPAKNTVHPGCGSCNGCPMSQQKLSDINQEGSSCPGSATQ